MNPKIVIVGGGASGFFTAVNISALNPGADIIILEQSSKVLSKVKISGGGRCNVTHACFDPKELVGFYPRGNKELLGPFHYFQPGDTMGWFEERNVPLKIEDDNRVFPVSDDSQTIIDCLLAECKKYKIKISTSSKVINIQKYESTYRLTLADNNILEADILVIAGGSSKALWSKLQDLGYEIEPPVPSLFTFNTQMNWLKKMMGTTFSNASIFIEDSKLESEGPLLITHWGISGPAVLKISAWGARWLHEAKYKAIARINWVTIEKSEVTLLLKEMQRNTPDKLLANAVFQGFTSKFWKAFIQKYFPDGVRLKQLTEKQIEELSLLITEFPFPINGKSTYKDEFVTCGGVKLHQIDTRKMESKLHENLYFTGEIMDVDAVTGGFNFQAAWTTAVLASRSIASKLEAIEMRR